MATRPENVGIKAIEVYFPSRYVSQTELEKYLGVSTGKFTIGLGQTSMSFCDDREDLYSLALTTVSCLLKKHTIDPNTIGRLEVGTETLLDKSKSAKSVLMSLFPNNPDIEGIDTYNACYGGTSAVINAVNWIESSSWDGRDAIVVAGDISLYDTPAARPTGGAGCVAMLIGADAPVVVEPIRASHMQHVYDFYKGDFGSEYPLVDGHFSNQCYMRALDGCYGRYREKVKQRGGYARMSDHAKEKEAKAKEAGIDMFDFFVFHAPNTKMVAKAYGRVLFNDYRSNPAAFDSGSIPAKYATMDADSSLTDKDVERLFMSLSKAKFTERVSPSLTIPANCGNSYTGSVWAGLASLLSNVPSETLQNKRIGVYSYGAGLASTLLTLRVRGDIEAIAQKMDLHARLAARTEVTPEFYNEMCQLREQAYQAKNYAPTGSVEDLAPGTYYLAHVDDQFRRQYEVKA
ncbi:putative hydroxymethylglutaryl-CoA synthase [Aspergillus melleus]|uniref:putative hydroxymethylglutaryl-CoA synthase n=1 Tax=Aspergillus melleus TaxID=138277 RepID=UPI001E8ECB17|nr:3-hydroxy-3-methylglutaryl coenzyme A synthase [Aspergillus melleus]KAH8422480.1 3-hydroxy-3-methylglutaryl coenzyme A synthase [Aspergillus melleus]